MGQADAEADERADAAIDESLDEGRALKGARGFVTHDVSAPARAGSQPLPEPSHEGSEAARRQESGHHETEERPAQMPSWLIPPRRLCLIKKTETMA